MAKAYLIAFLKDVGTPFPAIVKASVYSESPLTLTNNFDTWPVTVFEVEGADYQEAQQKLIDLITCREPGLEWAPLDWAVPWVTEGTHTVTHVFDRPREDRKRFNSPEKI